MILVDANLLIYAHVSGMPAHKKARQWLESKLSDISRIGLPWASLLAFVRLITNPRVFTRPSTIRDAWAQVEEWLAGKRVWIPEPGPAHAQILGRLLLQGGYRPDLVPDAHLAAVAIEHGLTLCSADADFSRFEGLSYINPIGTSAP